jgi:hypothetical protein
MARRTPHAIADASTLLIALVGVIAVNVLADGQRDLSAHYDETAPVIALPEPWEAIPDALISGTLQLVEECLLLDDVVVVWPHGTTWDDSSDTVVASDFEFGLGDIVTGGGGAMPDIGPDSSDRYGEDGVAAITSCMSRTGSDGVVIVFPDAG